ncbi:MAG: hypothetical protein KAT96_02575 [Candidatus Omnitrophica bacterium]|nr:hypothetical protein [Candidatus Omnitrophota bacterium]
MAIHIKHLVGKFLEKKKQDFRHQEKVQQIVNRFLNNDARESVYLKRISKGEFVFGAVSSSFAYDFGLKKDRVLSGIKKEFPQIKDIKIEIG